MIRPEILAPAGTFEAVKAAVYCGADAVYLGGKSLNARRNASNFDEEELKNTVEFCHIRGVKVYQTINIVIFENEIDELVEAAKEAARIGVDAIIVQDLGVVKVLHQMLPDMPLIASTQMAVHNVNGALEAERLGCSVIVAAREMSVKEIAEMINALTTAKVEVFIHGAMCMSVSGQCYLSSMLGGRSGNRGLCAQPCRLPFECGSSTHALSLKDLSLATKVKELQNIGVASLKIEGRMKRPEYVAAAVTAVKDALDGKAPDLDSLRSIFSRSGFSSAYFDGKISPDMFGIRQKEDVVAAKEVLSPLARMATTETQRVEIKGKLICKKDKNITLEVDDGKNKVLSSGDIPLIANNAPSTKERLEVSLNKTGQTPYKFTDIKIELDEGLLIPASSINALRRNALEELNEKRKAFKEIKVNEYKESKKVEVEKTKPKIISRLKIDQLSKETFELNDKVILPLDDIEKALNEGYEAKKIIAEIPRIMYTQEKLVIEKLKALKEKGIKETWSGNICSIKIARDLGFLVHGGWSLNIANSEAIRQLKEMGVNETEISIETPLSSFKKISGDIPFGIVAYGYLPLMAYRSCPVKASIGCEKCKHKGYLTDRMGTVFNVRCRDGISELLNSVPLYLSDRLNEYAPSTFFTLWFNDESKEETLKIVKAYVNQKPIEEIKEITRGLYTRTVY